MTDNYSISVPRW